MNAKRGRGRPKRENKLSESNLNQSNLNKLRNEDHLDKKSNDADSTVRRALRPRTELKTRKELRSTANQLKANQTMIEIPDFELKKRGHLDFSRESRDKITDENAYGHRKMSRNAHQLLNEEKENDNLDKQLNQIDYEVPVLRKRKIEELENEAESEPEFKRRKSENDEVYVFIEIKVTGFKPIDEIVKLCAFVDPLSKVVCNYIYPKKKLIVKDMIQASKMEVTRNLIIDHGQMCDYLTDHSIVLNDFVNLIESLNSDNVILVYENQYNLTNLPNILINHLRKFGLYERVEDKLVGFVDCNKLFQFVRDDNGKTRKPFVLESRVKEAGLKCSFSSQHPLYRLDLLSNYFQAKIVKTNKNVDEYLMTLEDAELRAEGQVDYFMRKKIQEEVKMSTNQALFESSLGTLEDIQKEIELLDTHDYLTSSEKRNLYLIQKLRRQFTNSKTYNPSAKFPKDSPKKKIIIEQLEAGEKILPELTT